MTDTQVIPTDVWTQSSRWPHVWVRHDAGENARITWHEDGTWTLHTSANWDIESRWNPAPPERQQP